MYRDHRIAVVIPAYRVAGHISRVVKGLPDFVDDVIVVDDASPDETSEVLAAIRDPRLHTIRHPVNRGVGGAMVSGFRLALDKGAAVVVKMDGDDQMDPSCLPAFLDAILAEGYGYAKGNRFLSGDRLRTMPTVRMLGSFCLTFLTKLASGYWHLFDPVNGYLAVDARVLAKLPLDRLAPRYFFETDMLIQLNILKIRAKDIPIPPRYGNEHSSMRVGTVLLTFPVHLLRGFLHRIYQGHVLRDFSPVALFWLLGGCLLLWGMGFGLYTWIKSSVTGHVATTGTVMLSVLPFILGFQLALQAILIEIQESPR